MFEPDSFEEYEKSIVKTIEELEQENKLLHDGRGELAGDRS